MIIKLFTKENIDQLIWPQNRESDQLKKFITPLLIEGVTPFIANVKTRLFLLQVENSVIPITVNEKEYDNAYVASNYVFLSILKQKIRSSKFLKVFSPFIIGLDLTLRWVKINKVVIVNNWLMTLSLYDNLDEVKIHKITEFLSHHFPDHSIMWRSLNNFKNQDLLHSLNQKLYHLIPTRNIYFFDPSKEKDFGQRAKRHLKQDAQLLKESHYKILSNSDLKEEDFLRLVELYEMIYINKYKNVSPILSEDFFKNLAKVIDVKFVCLKKEKIDGFCVLLKRNNEMSMAYVGHDTKLPLSEGIYRILNHLAVIEAKNSNLLFNQSSGADSFKQWRGGIKILEYIALFDRHLPFARRILFEASSKAVKLLGK